VEYHKWLLESDVPKLMFWAVPGAFVGGESEMVYGKSEEYQCRVFRGGNALFAGGSPTSHWERNCQVHWYVGLELDLTSAVKLYSTSRASAQVPEDSTLVIGPVYNKFN
jgi:hypothetical protein